MTESLRVIKLGGSLLDWPELPSRFGQWTHEQPPAANVVVVGGGPLVDELRELDRRHGLPVDEVHWAAIRVMDLMAELFSDCLGASLVRDLDGISRAAGAVQVLCVEPMLRADAHREGALPLGWDVTSDSIAARVATLLDAGELVLLKSASAAERAGALDWAATGLVDRHFPRACEGLRVRLVNLRA